MMPLRNGFPRLATVTATVPQKQEGKISEPSTEDDSDEGGSSISLSTIYLIGLYFFLVGAPSRREERQYDTQQDQSTVNADGDIN